MIILDGAQGLIFIPVFFILDLIVTVIIEGYVMYLFRFKDLRACFSDAIRINLLSLISGMPLFFVFADWARDYIAPNISFIDKSVALLILFYLQTIIIEGVFLYFINRKFPLKKLIPMLLLMNLVTYIVIYFVLMALK